MQVKTKTILVVDDDFAVLTSLSLLLKQSGYGVLTAGSPIEALNTLESNECDLILQDMNYSRCTTGEEGLELLRKIKEIYPDKPVILITAWASISLAVKGIKAGACDFVTKPWSHEQILQSIGTAIDLSESGHIEKRIPHLSRADLDRKFDFDSVIGEDPAFLNILEVVGRICSTDASVLIIGSSGTGKEIIAESVWGNSHRKTKPFVKVNLAGIPSTLFESEMFGHVKGAFTDARFDRIGRFEAAHNGTIFLDEIGDLEISNQAKLLRVLQDRTFEKVGSSRNITSDVRIISASNRNFQQMIDSGEFREDLYYRLNLITLHLPDLKDREDDIPLLTKHFLKKINERYNRKLEIDNSAIKWLLGQSWPGNIRQLKQVIERTVLLTKNDTLGVDDFEAANKLQNRENTIEINQNLSLENLEKHAILAGIDNFNGNISRVAKSLGISRAALYRRMKKYGIEY